ncbi:MAG: biotin transporter BioY [Aigarchaeota archaeon]|nr:biotin transporter BioY [Candidatus Pelearchaeum maunauluense]
MNSKSVAAVLAGFFAALTAVGAWVTIPLAPVPFTLQVFFVLLSGLLLGPRLGFSAMLVYIALGALGVPVFSGFSAGLLRPTAGYLIAFPLAAAMAGYIAKTTTHAGFLRLALASIVALSVIYALGLLWLYYWLNIIANTPTTFAHVFQVGAAAFIPIDLVKAILAAALAHRLRRIGVFRRIS